jgi:hypothetical protein
LPAIIRIHGTERGVDATGGEDSVGIHFRTLPHQQDLVATLVQLYRRAQSGSSSTDYQYAGLQAERFLVCAHLSCSFQDNT